MIILLVVLYDLDMLMPSTGRLFTVLSVQKVMDVVSLQGK